MVTEGDVDSWPPRFGSSGSIQFNIISISGATHQQVKSTGILMDKKMEDDKLMLLPFLSCDYFPEQWAKPSMHLKHILSVFLLGRCLLLCCTF